MFRPNNVFLGHFQCRFRDGNTSADTAVALKLLAVIAQYSMMLCRIYIKKVVYRRQNSMAYEFKMASQKLFFQFCF
jgi:hypothetical protein